MNRNRQCAIGLLTLAASMACPLRSGAIERHRILFLPAPYGGKARAFLSRAESGGPVELVGSARDAEGRERAAIWSRRLGANRGWTLQRLPDLGNRSSASAGAEITAPAEGGGVRSLRAVVGTVTGMDDRYYAALWRDRNGDGRFELTLLGTAGSAANGVHLGISLSEVLVAVVGSREIPGGGRVASIWLGSNDALAAAVSLPSDGNAGAIAVTRLPDGRWRIVGNAELDGTSTGAVWVGRPDTGFTLTYLPSDGGDTATHEVRDMSPLGRYIVGARQAGGGTAPTAWQSVTDLIIDPIPLYVPLPGDALLMAVSDGGRAVGLLGSGYGRGPFRATWLMNLDLAPPDQRAFSLLDLVAPRERAGLGILLAGDAGMDRLLCGGAEKSGSPGLFYPFVALPDDSCLLPDTVAVADGQGLSDGMPELAVLWPDSSYLDLTPGDSGKIAVEGMITSPRDPASGLPSGKFMAVTSRAKGPAREQVTQRLSLWDRAAQGWVGVGAEAIRGGDRDQTRKYALPDDLRTFASKRGEIRFRLEFSSQTRPNVDGILLDAVSLQK